jgi:hypothetical protein
MSGLAEPRARYDFPPRPETKEDIYGSDCPPWLTACSLVGKFDRWQVNTYRKLYGIIGDWFFRDVLDATRVILDESRNIIAPPAFLAAQLKLAAEGKEIYR